MAFFGPRLDRPSAVGTEGRPRATSLTIASVTVVGLFALTGWAVGSPAFVLQFGTLIGFTVAGAALQTRQRLAHRFVGHLSFFGFGTALVTRLVSVGSLAAGLVVGGFVLAMVAVGLTWANVGDRSGIRETTLGVGYTYGALFVWLIAIGGVAVAGDTVFSVVTDSGLTDEPVLSFVAVAAMLAGVALALWLALGTLPVLQLTPRRRRDRMRRRLGRARWLTSRLAVFAAAAAVVGLVLAGYGGRGVAVSGTDPVGTVLLAVGSPVVLVALVVVGSIAVVATALARATRLLTTHVDPNTGRLVAAMAAAGLLFALMGAVVGLGPGLLDETVLALVLLLPLLVILLLVAGLAAIEVGLMPDRAGGPAVAAAVLFVAGVGAALAGVRPPVAFAVVAGALVVWDVSTYGLGITAELGHRPETRRLELFHAVLAVGVGVFAVLALWGVVVGRRLVDVGEVGPGAPALLVLGVVLLAAALRG